MAKKKEPTKCSKCGVELSLKEMNQTALVNYEGDLYGSGRYFCAICKGDQLHKMGFKE